MFHSNLQSSAITASTFNRFDTTHYNSDVWWTDERTDMRHASRCMRHAWKIVTAGSQPTHRRGGYFLRTL